MAPTTTTRLLAVVVGLGLVVAACGGATSDTTETLEAPATVAAQPSTTTTVTTTTAAPTTLPPSTTTTTLAPTTTTRAAVEDLASGLFCRDLYPLGYSYAEAVMYWILEGQPDRMDADRNGIPCETVYPASDVKAVWGDPLPTTPPTTSGTVYAVGDPNFAPDPLPGSGGAAGSGCAPGTDTLPDGIWFGYVTRRNANQVTFDLACLWITPDADVEYSVQNDNPELRTVPVASGADVYHITWDPFFTVLGYPDWLGRDCYTTPCPAWLYINQGTATTIVEQFLA